MQNILAADFYLFGAILIGLCISSFSFLNAEKPIPNVIKFWAASAIFAVVQYLISGIGVQYSQSGFSTENLLFVFSNAAYLASVVFQALFCIALTSNVSAKKQIFTLGFLVAFSIQSLIISKSSLSYLAGFEIAFLVPILQSVQIFYLHKSCKEKKSAQLNLLTVFTSIQLAFTLTRLAVVSYKIFVMGDVISPLSFEELPIALVVISTANMFFNVLSYQTMVGYWAANAVTEKIQTHNDNLHINQLLIDRNQLISSLSRVNKVSIAGALSASMAHELNQPLGSVRLNIQVLKSLLEQSDVLPIAKQVMQDIENENNRAAKLIKTLRAIFVQDSFEKNNFNLNELIQSVGDLYKGKLQEAEIAINYSLNTAKLIAGNSLEFHQVIANLVSNSIDALISSNTASPSISIETYEDNSWVFLSIIDNGPGISEEQLAQIYDLIKPSTKTAGMGFGLWLVKFIVERHGGQISYAPVLSGGAKFLIKIPHEELN